MVELTIQVPEQVVRRLEPIRDRLPMLLARVAETRSPFPAPPDATRPAGVPLAYAEVIEFLAYAEQVATGDDLDQLMAQHRASAIEEPEVLLMMRQMHYPTHLPWDGGYLDQPHILMQEIYQAELAQHDYEYRLFQRLRGKEEIVGGTQKNSHVGETPPIEGMPDFLKEALKL